MEGGRGNVEVSLLWEEEGGKCGRGSSLLWEKEDGSVPSSENGSESILWRVILPTVCLSMH